MALLVDTGVLLGAADADDADHAATSQLLYVPVPVIAETSWQIERNLGPEAEARFLGAVIAGELTRMRAWAEFEDRYGPVGDEVVARKLPGLLGLADALPRRERDPLRFPPLAEGPASTRR